MGLDDTLDKYKGVKATQDSLKMDQREKRTFDKLICTYEAWLTEYRFVRSIDRGMENVRKEIKNLNISSDMIKNVCFSLKKYEDDVWFFASGIYMTAILKHSYECGNNKFDFPLEHLNCSLNFFGFGLLGKEANRIELNFKGNLGTYCCAGTEYLDASFNGDVEFGCGVESEHSEFLFNGNIGNGCCLNARWCDIVSTKKQVLDQIRAATWPFESCKLYLLGSKGTREAVDYL